MKNTTLSLDGVTAVRGEPGLGYVSLTELPAVRGKLGLPIDRDEHIDADEARAGGLSLTKSGLYSCKFRRCHP